MKYSRLSNIILMGSVFTASLVLGQKPHPSQFVKPDPFRVNTVSPIGQQNVQITTLSGTAEQKARQFLTMNVEPFQMQPGLEDLALEKVEVSPGGYHVRFYQTYRGVPVHRSEIVVSINSENQASFYMSNYHPRIKLTSVIPSISAEEALSLAQDALKSGELYADPQVDLLVLPLADGHQLGYRVMLPTKEPLGDWEIFVDAIKGEII